MALLFFFNDTATTEIYTLSLHDALPIYRAPRGDGRRAPLHGAPIHPQAADDIEIERHARIAVVLEDWTNDADGTQPFRRDLHDGGRMRIAAGKVNARREFPRPDGTHRRLLG